MAGEKWEGLDPLVCSRLTSPTAACPLLLPLSACLLLQYLVAGEKWEGLDPLVRSRLLLAPLFMRRRELSGELQPSLARLAAAGLSDK